MRNGSPLQSSLSISASRVDIVLDPYAFERASGFDKVSISSDENTAFLIAADSDRASLGAEVGTKSMSALPRCMPQDLPWRSY